jgi:hypothetical protein
MRRSIVAAAALVLLLTPLSIATAQDDLPTAESAAKAVADTEDGKKFQEAVGSAFGREHGSTIQRCAKEAKGAGLANFDLFLRIGQGGTVDEALVNPPGPIASCVKDKMTGWRVSVPPHPGFWVKVGVNLKSK